VLSRLRSHAMIVHQPSVTAIAVCPGRALPCVALLRAATAGSRGRGEKMRVYCLSVGRAPEVALKAYSNHGFTLCSWTYCLGILCLPAVIPGYNPSRFYLDIRHPWTGFLGQRLFCHATQPGGGATEP
jgi:hypothetical protein